jgi:hypothetical protein
LVCDLLCYYLECVCFCKYSYALDISSSYHCISFISFLFLYFLPFCSILIFLAYLSFEGGFAYNNFKICRLYLVNVLRFLIFSLHCLHNTHLLLFLCIPCQQSVFLSYKVLCVVLSPTIVCIYVSFHHYSCYLNLQH